MQTLGEVVDKIKLLEVGMYDLPSDEMLKRMSEIGHLTEKMKDFPKYWELKERAEIEGEQVWDDFFRDC